MPVHQHEPQFVPLQAMAEIKTVAPCDCVVSEMAQHISICLIYPHPSLVTSMEMFKTTTVKAYRDVVEVKEMVISDNLPLPEMLACFLFQELGILVRSIWKMKSIWKRRSTAALQQMKLGWHSS